ncbi:MAG: hypothetical protein KC615_17805 [Anaerolineae bacterium]|nr:hypothetical protein [Anaerolineae bacterium]
MVSLPRRRWLLLALLLLVAAIALVIASRMSISAADAHLIWQIYPHDWPNLDAGASAAVRSVLGDFQQVWERRTEIWPLYPLLLNAWALVFGESQLALRLPNILSGLLALAALAHLLKNTPYRLIWITLVAALLVPWPMLRLGPAALALGLSLWSVLLFIRWRQFPVRWRFILYLLPTIAMLLTGWIGWLVLLAELAYVVVPWLRTEQNGKRWLYGTIVALLIMGIVPLISDSLPQPQPDWQGIVHWAADERDSSAVALYVLPDDHPLIYYDRQVGLLDAIAINLGWQQFTPAQIDDIVRRLQNQPVIWVLVTTDAYGQGVHDIAAEGRQQVVSQVADDVLIARYDLE